MDAEPGDCPYCGMTLEPTASKQTSPLRQRDDLPAADSPPGDAPPDDAPPDDAPPDDAPPDDAPPDDAPEAEEEMD